MTKSHKKDRDVVSFVTQWLMAQEKDWYRQEKDKVVLRYMPQVWRELRGKGVGQQYNYIWNVLLGVKIKNPKYRKQANFWQNLHVGSYHSCLLVLFYIVTKQNKKIIGSLFYVSCTVHCNIIIQHKTTKYAFVKLIFLYLRCLLYVLKPRVYLQEDGCT